MVPFIDSHTHLADPAFDDDREAAIARAREAGARSLVCIGESIEAAHRARSIASRHAGFVFWTAGIHPHDAASFDEARDIPALDACLTDGAVAVGECGLDYHYDNSPRDAQRAAVRAQIALAARRARPVVIHTRDAEDDTRAVIAGAAAAGVGGVLHCYTGSAALAEYAIDRGWYVSFSGIITFKKFDDDALLALVPPNRLLVESDAPYLAPVPYRGKRNEPAWVPLTLARLSRARHADLEELTAATVENARRLFGLASSSPAG
ncbi:MAG TPA: TatD family hydrolase [Gemmatimonadaceae bacterium]